MAQKIDSEKMVLNEIFQMWFRIPEYQRAYVWDEDQVRELLEDTFEESEQHPDSQYFLGTLVLNCNHKSSQAQESKTSVEYEEYDVLDGQQRLTTLYILWIVIRDLAIQQKNDQLANSCKKKIFQRENPYENIPERMRLVFDIRSEVAKFINYYAQTEGSTTKDAESFPKIRDDERRNVSIRNMAGAFHEVREFLLAHQDSLKQYATFMFMHVLLIYVSSENLQDAFQMFTVLNNRGVKLSNCDILKAENLKEVYDIKQRQQYASEWEEMESFFADNFDNFLSQIRMILMKKRQLYNLLKEFDEGIYAGKVYNRATKEYETQEPLLKRGSDTFEYIDKYFEYYKEIFDTNYSSDKIAIQNLLTLMKTLYSDFWMAPVLDYYRKFRYEKFYEFLCKLDAKFSADIITSESPTQRVENMNAVLQMIDKCDTPDDLLASQVFDFSAEDLLAALNSNIYSKKHAKYVMLKIDLLYHGNTEPFRVPTTVSIEHILPQNPRAESQWARDFTEEERYEWTNKLGNLMLLSRRKNSSLSNLDYADKSKRYFEKNIELFSNSVNIYQKHKTWTLKDLTDNHAEIMRRLKESYGIKE